MTPEQLRTQAVLAQKGARWHFEHGVAYQRSFYGRDHLERIHQGGKRDNYARARAAVDAWLEATATPVAEVITHARAEMVRLARVDVEGAPTKPMRAVAVVSKKGVLTDAVAPEDEA